MNRETKRAIARQGRSTPSEPGARMQQVRRQQAARRQPGRTPRRKGPRVFLEEVVEELQRVGWPRMNVVGSYTVVVIIAVTLVTAMIFGLDALFGKAVLALFG